MKPKTFTPEVLRKIGAYLKQHLQDKLIEHKQYIDKYGENLSKIRNRDRSIPQ